MSGTVLEHPLVRSYLSELDAAMRHLPPEAGRELGEQISAHPNEALRPDAGDQEVAAVLGRLGSPAGPAAEAGAASARPGRPPTARPARLARVLWTSGNCSWVIDQLNLRVRVGWFTKTELIPCSTGH